MGEKIISVKEQFEKDVLSVLSKLGDDYKKFFDSICNKKIFVEVCQKYYIGHYWFCLKLTPNIEKNEEYEKVTAILIKPYRITQNDIKEPINESRKNRKKDCFKDEEDRNVDYDGVTGNYHKQIKSVDYKKNIKYQIILANQDNRKNQYGPGWKKALVRGKSPTEENIKTDWYFPQINDEECEKSLTQLIIDALDAIYGNKTE